MHDKQYLKTTDDFIDSTCCIKNDSFRGNDLQNWSSKMAPANYTRTGVYQAGGEFQNLTRNTNR